MEHFLVQRERESYNIVPLQLDHCDVTDDLVSAACDQTQFDYFLQLPHYLSSYI